MKRLLIAAFAACIGLALPDAHALAQQRVEKAAPAAQGNAVKKAKPQRTAKSLECSKQANAQAVHGKERRRFMDRCKRS